MGAYRVILADPPWAYNNDRIRGAAANHYGTAAAPDIAALPVADLAHPAGALLLCWATLPLLPTAIGCVAGWGFDYITAIPWVKINRIAVDLFTGQSVARVQWGTGFWARGAAELLLVCKRGTVDKPASGLAPLGLIDGRRLDGAIALGPRLAHSKKLKTAHEYGSLFPGPRVELFARAAVDGWDLWGNQAPAAIAWPAGDRWSAGVKNA